MLGWLWLFLTTAPLTSVGLFREFEIKFVIRFGVTVFGNFSPPFVVIRDFSPLQVRHIEVSQSKRTRELPQLVETKKLGEAVGVLPIRRDILKFDFTGEDTLADKVVVHLNVLSPGVEDGVLR